MILHIFNSFHRISVTFLALSVITLFHEDLVNFIGLILSLSGLSMFTHTQSSTSNRFHFLFNNIYLLDLLILSICSARKVNKSQQ